MSSATLYRVELLSTDNPAALISCAFSLSHPHSSTVVLLSLCHFTSYLCPFLYCLTGILLLLYGSFFPPLSFHQVSSHKRVSILQWCLADHHLCAYVCCVTRCCQWYGSEPSGASKGDYELILAEEAGNSFKPTKLFHQPPAGVLKNRHYNIPKTQQRTQLSMHTHTLH